MPVDNPNPVHPGLCAESFYMTEMGVTRADLKRYLGVSQAFVDDFLEGREDVTTDLAGKLAGYLGTSVNLWVEMQSQYDRVHTKKT